MQMPTKAMQPVLPKPNSSSLKDNRKSVSSIADKELRKKLRNRQSALAARERKKARMLQLEQTVNELQLANRRLTQENAKYRQMFDTSNLRHSNYSDRGNYGLLDCRWERNTRSNEGDWLTGGDGYGNSTTRPQPEFRALAPKTESQTCEVAASDNSSLAHFANYGSHMPMRKKSINLPANPDLNPDSYQQPRPLKLSEKRRKSCPSYPASTIPNEFQWTKPCSSISGRTVSVSSSDFSPHPATCSSSIQRRSSEHSLCQSPFETSHKYVQEPVAEIVLDGNSSLPPINNVLGGSNSTNGERSFSTHVHSGYSRIFNFGDGGNIPAKRENTDGFNYKGYSPLTDFSHQGAHHIGVPKEFLKDGVRDVYQNPKQTPALTGHIFDNHQHLEYGGINTFDEIFEWISEEQ